uniref:Myosin class i heavy chain n=2 Tax=Lutzomyia longipalpis TaxID=7200 RepID=A0A1B0CB62_LUTLO
MLPIAGGGKFVEIGDKIRFPDDVTMGFIVEHLLRIPLTVVDQFHSHLEPMEFLRPEMFHDQVSFSYARMKNEWNVVKIDGFDTKTDPKRFYSLHCHLFPYFSFCPRINAKSGKMSIYELYVKGARVWIPNQENVWQGAKLLRDFNRGDNCVILEADGETTERKVPIKDDKDLPPLRNPPILIGQSDLTALSYLHEPDVLYNLQVRFCERQKIYTYCGIILVAINPYKEVALYGQDLIRAYRGHSLGELEPHIFAIAEEAYTKLELSGESGAGKTVSAKYAMRYFAAVGGSESETQIERKVLASSPIMEVSFSYARMKNEWNVSGKMSIYELYVKGARVWILNQENVWQGAKLLRDFNRGDNCVILEADGETTERKVPIKDDKDLPPLRNPPILIGQSDLTALSYLHEPDVLYNLQVRFCERQKIYTYCGIILVAINPYKEVALYGQDLIRAYRGHSLGELEPHIFAIAEEAYTKLERENCNQSIIGIFFCTPPIPIVFVNSSHTHSHTISLAIGNAKTTRNDNSSRFGKFTKLLFTNDIGGRSLMGATMQTYLLEKSRVVFQASGERNYHIFYQLCAAREKWPELMLGECWDDFLPNEDKKAFNWEPSKIVQQLRACGVLETVRISAAGFPSRWTYEDFYARYRLLGKRVELDKDQYRYGKTQIFFRAGQVAFLEQTRSDVRRKYIIKVQSYVRRFIYRSHYVKIKRSILLIQTYSRGYLARVKAEGIRRERAAIKIQRYARGWMCRRKFLRLRRIALGLQTYSRGWLARQRFRIQLDNFKATEIQRICRGYLARKRFAIKRRGIVLCQAAIRAFLARRLYRRMKAEARTVAHIQMRYKGIENKIISMQQRMDEINKENVGLKAKVAEIPELKQRVDVMRGMEGEIKALRAALVEKEAALEVAKKELDTERDEKMAIVEEKAAEEAKWNEQRASWRRENEELKQQVQEMVEIARREDSFTHRARLLSEVDTHEVHQAYQKTVKDKDTLESENYLLKEEIHRLQRLIENPNFYQSHSRSVSNASSQNEEDFGYISGKNTLEIRKEGIPKRDLKHTETAMTPTTGNSPTALILRLRKLVEEEKRRGEMLQQKVARLESKNSKAPASTEDSIKITELEMENEKLRQDYQLLRNSITRGVEQKEMEAQYDALQEELKRRRDECVQLKVVLAEQSQSLRTLGGTAMRNGTDRVQDGNELIEAFQAQKLVNRQLESELTALTEENNANHVEEALAGGDVNDAQSVVFLKHELERAMVDYVEHKERINDMTKKVTDLVRINAILSARLRENGTSDSLDLAEDTQENLVSVRRKAQVYQGIFKYRPEDEGKIIQRLTADFSPRTGITLLPGLPAYIILMCIRYTDLLNTDQHVRTLLTNFVLQVKKLYRGRVQTDNRILWLVNMLKLYNLLKQYGGIDEHIRLNTETQNQQQLKNFDLSEYRQVIYETIISFYQHIVKQVEELIKPFIVPAILDHDEMARGKSSRSRTVSLDLTSPQGQTTEPKSLVDQLEHYYKQFRFFGLDDCYIEQVLKQLVYYICAIALNNLMLRQELCMWATGMKIRYNISCIEQWVRKNKLPPEILSPLQPLIQASALLQSRKSEEDVQSIYDLCPSLTSAQLEHYYKQFRFFGLDDCYIEQVLKQLVYYICAIALNNLMLRQELCMWATGMKIRYNISCIEQWVRKNKLPPEILSPLQPLIQASALLQSRKSEEDVQSIYDLCPSLTTYVNVVFTDIPDDYTSML